jgi:hypothetical protein
VRRNETSQPHCWGVKQKSRTGEEKRSQRASGSLNLAKKEGKLSPAPSKVRCKTQGSRGVNKPHIRSGTKVEGEGWIIHHQEREENIPGIIQSENRPNPLRLKAQQVGPTLLSIQAQNIET